MEPHTKDLQPELTAEQWLLIADLFSHRPLVSQGARLRINARACFEGICGCIATVLAENSYRPVFRRTSLVAVVSSSGLAMVFGAKLENV